MSKVLDIEVTSRDIHLGVRDSNDACPIARAIRRKTGKKFVEVQPTDVWVGDEDYLPSQAATRFMCDFDDGRKVAPARFRLRKRT